MVEIFAVLIFAIFANFKIAKINPKKKSFSPIRENKSREI